MDIKETILARLTERLRFHHRRFCLLEFPRNRPLHFPRPKYTYNLCTACFCELFNVSPQCLCLPAWPFHQSSDQGGQRWYTGQTRRYLDNGWCTLRVPYHFKKPRGCSLTCWYSFSKILKATEMATLWNWEKVPLFNRVLQQYISNKYDCFRALNCAQIS